MLFFILKRVAMGVGLVLLVLTLIFSALQLVPGDPAVLLLSTGDGGAPSPEAVEKLREQLGLNQPLLTQYFSFLSGVFTGDLGESFRTSQPVLEAIGARLPRTLMLVVFATVLSIVIGVAMGAIAARRGGWVDTLVTALSSIGVALPVFVFGAVLILLFSITLKWFPAGGYVDPSKDLLGSLASLTLPAIALAVGFAAQIARMTRSAVLEVQTQDWVRTAKSIGLAPFTVFRRHVLRNSLTPVVTVVGIGFGTLLGSTVLVERVFNYPGLSSLLVDGVTTRDYPVVQGVVIVIALLFIAINIVVDIIYGILDPRVRRA
ncbi:ABC transporter permease [Microbacterium saperdae]|uniref:Peptide/nickel transport system permease protein n=1 Tax=Microbacterium saperdae TaxID=69368 RepID=A0A543BA60_9MICO|nr:ABC transporter permease [Microbacterium saperdae]TQL81734.1 peptide/nickel transport system permease protein [Microbacterium saperdae]GGM34420.1 peptide ABC transporter permease [Microbacterium saperdae]